VHVREDAHGGEGQQHEARQDQPHDPGCERIRDRDGDATGQRSGTEDKQADRLKPVQSHGETVAMADPFASCVHGVSGAPNVSVSPYGAGMG
jgi:hypothetical protein